ncbi:MAG: hydantoinase B/oxoprolinase family protein [Chloroflexi bacterium]|nr:hydantoinase B/oxoprolinase family protein [Chloroflexota bacterium]
MSEAVQSPMKVDPVTFELVRNSLKAACAEMALVVSKTAYSVAINEGKDFAGTISDAKGNLVTQSDYDLPAFVGLSMYSTKEVVKQIGLENMEPDDIYWINDPYVASTHCNDMHFVRPVFYEGRVAAFVESTAHWSDVGGAVPGSLNSRAVTHYDEGVRLPAVRVYRKGELQRDVVSLVMTNVRDSWERMGDLNAQCSALRTGDSRLQEMFRKHGLQTVWDCMEELQDYSERMIRSALRSIPDGTYKTEDYNDQVFESGNPAAFRVTLTIEGDHATFDLSDSDETVPGSINTTIVSTTSSLFNSLGAILPPMPMNAGVMRAIDIKTRRGSICHALPPTAVSLQASSMEILVGCGVQVLSQALPERGAGTCSTILNTVFTGIDERETFGEEPFLEYVWAVGGMGGTKYKDGPSVVGTAFTATIQNIPAELQERRYPLFWRRYQIKPNTGGPGKRRGGLGLDQLCEFPFVGGQLTNFGNRAEMGPPGCFGGERGATAGLVMNEGTENERRVGLVAVNVPVSVGETLHYWSAGGGGYGDPLDRAIEDVVADVQDDLLSIANAREQYGVVMSERDRQTLDYAVDVAATDALRKELRAQRA